MPEALTQEEFINKCKEVHGDNYDYDKVVFINVDSFILVKCNFCGEYFNIRAKKHLYRKQGHKKCENEKCRLRKIEEGKLIFVSKAKEVWDDSYDYSEIVYNGLSKTVENIYCKKHNYYFNQSARSHIHGNLACEQCREEAFKLTREDFIAESKKVWGDKFNYDLVLDGFYLKNDKVKLICNDCGHEFEVMIRKHLKKTTGCKGCDVLSRTITTEEFINKSKFKYDDKFDYSKTEYTNAKSHITLICKEHCNEFSILPHNHFKSPYGGCCKCSNSGYSSVEKELCNYIKDKYSLDILENYKFQECKNSLELDIFIKHYNIGFEFNGCFWHSTKFHRQEEHLNKILRCKEQDITLFNIWEHEWKNNRDVVYKNICRFFCDKHDLECFSVIPCEKEEAKEFFLENSLDYKEVHSNNVFVLYKNDKVACFSYEYLNDTCKIKSFESKVFDKSVFITFVSYINSNITIEIDNRFYFYIDHLQELGFVIEKEVKPYEILYSLNKKYEVKDKSLSKTFSVYNFGKTILTKNKNHGRRKQFN